MMFGGLADYHRRENSAALVLLVRGRGHVGESQEALHDTLRVALDVLAHWTGILKPNHSHYFIRDMQAVAEAVAVKDNM